MGCSTRVKQIRNSRKTHDDFAGKMEYTGTTTLDPNHRHHFGALMLWAKKGCFNNGIGAKEAGKVRLLSSYRRRRLRNCKSIGSKTVDHIAHKICPANIDAMSLDSVQTKVNGFNANMEDFVQRWDGAYIVKTKPSRETSTRSSIKSVTTWYSRPLTGCKLSGNTFLGCGR